MDQLLNYEGYINIEVNSCESIRWLTRIYDIRYNPFHIVVVILSVFGIRIIC